MTDTHPELDEFALASDEGAPYDEGTDDGEEGYDDGPDGDSEGGEPMRGGSPREGDPDHQPDPSRIAQHVSRFSDRAIQRVVGGNAFLRGRQYARRGDVHELDTAEGDARALIQVKQDTYEPRLTIADDSTFTSSCTCAGFRGPTQHCKHVAALLVALRDRERPPRPKQQQQQNGERSAVASAPAAHAKNTTTTTTEIPPGASHTVSVGGKRRRSRRRRRGTETNGISHLEVLTTREPGPAILPGPIGAPPAVESRSAFDVWLPGPEEQSKPFELEFRMQVRSASITITPVIAGTRTSVPIADALSSFHAVSAPMRPIMRALARHATRNAPAMAELRAEDAAEMLSMLKDRRVLIEPASMELRFSEDALRPRIELDQANGRTCRVRVVFESKGGVRRFPLSSGAWFEGTPGWHVDTTEGIARPVSDTVTPAWLQRLYRSPALIHPMSELPRLLGEFIPRVAASLGAELPDLSQVADLVDASPRFRLQLDGDILEAHAKIGVYYGDQLFPVPPGEFPSPLAFMPPREPGGRPRVVRRDVGAEMSAVQQLMNLGFAVDESREGLECKGEPAITFWTDGIVTLPAEWEKLVPHDLRAVKVRDAAVAPQVRVASGVDWLSLDMSFSAGGVAVDEDELRNALEKGRRLVKLADGTFAPVKTEEVREVLDRMAEIVAGTSGAKVPLSQAGRIQDLLRLVGHKTVSAAAKEVLGKLEEIGDIEQIAKPRNLKVAQFRDYQKRGFSWLVFLHNIGTGGILADDMGLGKTLQTIALLVWLKSKTKGHKPTLVVAPTSVVPNWAREIEKFAPSLTTLIWQGPDRHERRDELEEVDVIITSYALLRRDEEILHSLDVRYVILDEAQHIKNPLSATARAAKKLQSDRRLALTGTPIENRLSEIWSIMDFVSPGLLGSLKAFEDKYARPVERGDQETIQKLRAIIRPFVLRRTKSEVAPELPAKIEQEMIVPLSDEQNKLYKQMLAQVRASLMSEVEKQGVAKAQIQILAALTRLRQVACDPRLTKMNAREGEWNDETSGKLSALREILQEAKAGGHRVLVFSQFVEMLQLIRKALDQDGVRYEYLDGSTKDRQQRVDHFNEDENVDAFLISLKAGGTGLNLTGADTVVHFDPWWNPAVEDQATDRAHRIGQSKVVSVYRLIAKGTVEEKILQLSGKKRDLMSNVLNTEGAPLKGLTKADIDELFSD
ncbi:MAG: DEAD/DEAH box helicase [Myxococcota bacterium]|nr:DEAD/DEAH box helicase [Myxococcota bacterium]